MTSLHLLQQGREYVYINRSILVGVFSRGMKKLEPALNISSFPPHHLLQSNQTGCVSEGHRCASDPKLLGLRDIVATSAERRLLDLE